MNKQPNYIVPPEESELDTPDRLPPAVLARVRAEVRREVEAEIYSVNLDVDRTERPLSDVADSQRTANAVFLPYISTFSG